MINFPDTVKLVETTAPDGYGDVEVQVLTDLLCNFILNTGNSHSNHVDIVQSDAHAYIDFNNATVVARAYRLEGMYIIAPLFNGIEQESWYKITNVEIGQDKLLCNQIDNIHVSLKKVDAL